MPTLRIRGLLTCRHCSMLAIIAWRTRAIWLSWWGIRSRHWFFSLWRWCCTPAFWMRSRCSCIVIARSLSFLVRGFNYNSIMPEDEEYSDCCPRTLLRGHTLISDVSAKHQSDKCRITLFKGCNHSLTPLTLVNVASHWGQALWRAEDYTRPPVFLQGWTNKLGIECNFVVLWCLFKSASRANCLVHPFILQGHIPVITGFFLLADFFLVVSFLSSD